MKCDKCGTLLENNEIQGSYESRGEFWGSPCSEFVVYGYQCKACGFMEEF